MTNKKDRVKEIDSIRDMLMEEIILIKQRKNLTDSDISKISTLKQTVDSLMKTARGLENEE